MWKHYLQNLTGWEVIELWILNFPPFCFFLRNLVIFRMSYLGTKRSFQKLFSHLSSSLIIVSKLLTCHGISRKLFFAVNLMTSFSRQKPLISKIQKQAIVGNTKFPLKTVNPFRNFHAVLLPPTLCKVETRKRKNFRIHASNVVCGVREGVGPVWIGKRPRNAQVSQDFCPWL